MLISFWDACCLSTSQISGRDPVRIWNVLIQFLAIAYAKAYKQQPEANDPYYNIGLAIDGLLDAYGLLSGAAFTIPISVVGIFMVSQSSSLTFLRLM
jgi:hypothetical protein